MTKYKIKIQERGGVTMDVVLLSRLQFGLTTIYHFFFVPLTIGLTLMVAIMETMYVRKKDASYQRMAKFWGKLLLINFAMGVVTGIVQEFQFGMNWSSYSRFEALSARHEAPAGRKEGPSEGCGSR